MNQCPSAEALENWIEARVSTAGTPALEDHVGNCSACQEMLESLCLTPTPLIAVAREAVEATAGTIHWSTELETRLAVAVQAADALQEQRMLASDTLLPEILGYKVQRLLGRGGMGIVVQAEHLRMKRQVAIKFLPMSSLKSSLAVDRFYRETRASAALTHPNIVGAYDAGEKEGIHYLVMEYVDGHDLDVVLKRLGPLRVEDVVECMIQTAQGLAYTHGLGIIHRDIKPSNLLLQHDGVIKILDMGLARLSDLGTDATEDDSQLTGVGEIMGTIDYMAPEQALDTRLADARSDIYSLGCTMYQLLTTASPFAGNTFMQKLLAHRESAIPNLSEARSEVPTAIDQIFKRMVAKNPDDRYQTMDELAADFIEVRNRQENWIGPNLFGVAQQAAQIGRTDLDPSPELYAETKVALADNCGTVKDELVPVVNRSGASDNNVRLHWIVASLGGFGWLLAALWMYIQTPEGLLKIEINDPSVEVSVNGNERLKVSGVHGEFEVAAGQHHLEVKVGKATFQTQEFTLGQGETVALRVTLMKDQKVQIARHGVPIEEHKILPSPSILSGEYPGTHALWINKREVEYVEIPTLTATEVWESFRRTQASTMELWIQRDRQRMDVHEQFIGIDGWAINSASGAGFLEDGEMYGRGAPPLRFRGIEGPLWHQRVASQWMHVAAVDELQNQRRFYINGKLVGTEPSTSEWGAGGGGKWDVAATLGKAMVGALGEARVSTIARYQGDFSPKFNMEVDEHTLALYRVDEGSGDILHDLSGNEHHGKIIGATWIEASEIITQAIEDQSTNAAAPASDATKSADASANWIDLLPLIDPVADTKPHEGFTDQGRREGAELVLGHRTLLNVPFDIDGDFELQAEFTVFLGPKFLHVTFPVLTKSPTLVLAESSNDLGYLGAGLSEIDGRSCLDSENPTHTKMSFLTTNKRQQLNLKVTHMENLVTIRANVDNSPLVDWTGPALLLPDPAPSGAPTKSRRLKVACYKGNMQLHSLKLLIVNR